MLASSPISAIFKSFFRSAISRRYTSIHRFFNNGWLNVNIENIETGTSSDPLAMANGGESAAFELEMDLSVPRSTPVMMLRQYVESLARELSITCDVNPL